MSLTEERAERLLETVERAIRSRKLTPHHRRGLRRAQGTLQTYLLEKKKQAEEARKQRAEQQPTDRQRDIDA